MVALVVTASPVGQARTDGMAATDAMAPTALVDTRATKATRASKELLAFKDFAALRATRATLDLQGLEAPQACRVLVGRQAATARMAWLARGVCLA